MCPVCQARFRGAAECSRCGADLTAITRMARKPGPGTLCLWPEVLARLARPKGSARCRQSNGSYEVFMCLPRAFFDGKTSLQVGVCSHN